MDKYDSYIIQKIMFLRLHCYLLLWNIHRIYNAALKMFLKRLQSEKKSKIWKPKNQLFCD